MSKTSTGPYFKMLKEMARLAKAANFALSVLESLPPMDLSEKIAVKRLKAALAPWKEVTKS